MLKWWVSHGDMTMYSHATILGVLLGQINSYLYTLKPLYSYVNSIDFIWTAHYLPPIFGLIGIYHLFNIQWEVISCHCYAKIIPKPLILHSSKLWSMRVLRKWRWPSGRLCRRLERQPILDHLSTRWSKLIVYLALGSFSHIRSGLVLLDRIYI